MICRFDGLPLTHEFADLGFSPPSNSFLTREQLGKSEAYFPLKVYVSERIFLVQLDEFKDHSEIFSDDYVYYSSYSSSWLEHSKRYVDMMVARFGFDATSQVVEIASNDGYLLQYFKEKNIPCFGIEPTAGTAAAAKAKGIESVIDFFGVALAKKLASLNRKADLILGNNVLAHVPDINDFVGGLPIMLNADGVITFEFPHLLKLVDGNQFDTIYHEHFSYLSFLAIKRIFEFHNLTVFDVEELSTHGGSLRVFAKHTKDLTHPISTAVADLINKEIGKGMNTLDYYKGFQLKINSIKNTFIQFLIQSKIEGKKIAAYGAAAKGNTLLNYCGIKTDLIDFVVDANINKQGKFLPGSHIPVVSEEMLMVEKPDYVIILPWNIKDEISRQLLYIRKWKGQFVFAIPDLKIF